MIEFSLWDILRNLLLALRWTVGLSLIAFVGGGVLGLALLVARIARLPGAERGVALYVQLFRGIPLLMQLFLAYFGWRWSASTPRRCSRPRCACRSIPAPT